MARTKIEILLATYNGERHLAAQIDSLFAQTNRDWRLIARDDGSCDRTVAILRDYAVRHPHRIELVEDADGGLGARGNFGRLMERATADYVMFCDQDDVWLPDKIDRLLEAMHSLEADCGADTPLIVHSDLRVVGPDLDELHRSFWEYQGIDPAFGRSINRLLIQNVVTGCASLCNRKLVEIALPVPAEAMMHDWWLALVGASFGRIGFVNESTVLYRQHSGNTLGAKRFQMSAMALRGLRAPGQAYSRARRILEATERQAQALLHRYGERMPGPIRDAVSLFAALSVQGFVERRLTILRHRFLTKGLVPRLVLLATI
ncbi:MAG: glycosyltransferase family 2 protein [Rhodospirillales bacterium]|nr:MAG: glycosyltransferase family 2 protein [Rhodospirillales bacterium]